MISVSSSCQHVYQNGPETQVGTIPPGPTPSAGPAEPHPHGSPAAKVPAQDERDPEPPGKDLGPLAPRDPHLEEDPDVLDGDPGGKQDGAPHADLRVFLPNGTHLTSGRTLNYFLLSFANRGLY